MGLFISNFLETKPPITTGFISPFLSLAEAMRFWIWVWRKTQRGLMDFSQVAFNMESGIRDLSFEYIHWIAQTLLKFYMLKFISQYFSY